MHRSTSVKFWNAGDCPCNVKLNVVLGYIVYLLLLFYYVVILL